MAGSKLNAAGFYWTLPVPWAGFTNLPEDVDKAARCSLTIRYQAALVRQFAQSHGYRLIKEQIFLELEPDRSSPFVIGPLQELIALCRQERASILYVDFSHEQGWRSHPFMEQLLVDSSLDIIAISASPVCIDGGVFDPFDHFSAWRRRQQRWKGDKEARCRSALERAASLYGQGRTWNEVARILNDEKLRTPTGKAWHGENLRKFMKTHAGLQSGS